MQSKAPQRLVRFIEALRGELAARPPFPPAEPPADFLAAAAAHLAELVCVDDWLDPAYRQPDARFYQQYLLYLDPDERFCVVSFVWGPGQKTPVHDHQVWGLVGVLQGAELCQEYRREAAGAVPAGGSHRLQPGEIEILSPQLGDVHVVENAFADQVSISIHVYGGDIGRVRRWVFPPGQERKPFISGYSNRVANPPYLLRAS